MLIQEFFLKINSQGKVEWMKPLKCLRDLIILVEHKVKRPALYSTAKKAQEKINVIHQILGKNKTINQMLLQASIIMSSLKKMKESAIAIGMKWLL